MALNLEALGRQILHGSRAAVEGKHPIAVITVEVMVMVLGLPVVGLARRFVAGGLTRQVNAQHRPMFQ